MITDYIIRARKSAILSKMSGEIISDNLLKVVILKGLPVEFKPLTSVITEKVKVLTFSKFKITLMCFEETGKNDWWKKIKKEWIYVRTIKTDKPRTKITDISFWYYCHRRAINTKILKTKLTINNQKTSFSKHCGNQKNCL